MNLKQEREVLVEAYQTGYNVTDDFDPADEIDGWSSMSQDERAMEASLGLEGYRSFGVYANSVMPRLRELAGFTDAGRGTFQVVPEDKPDPYPFLIELVDTFSDGYYDGFYGLEKDHTRHIGSDL